jgi:hypothetical protein
MHKPVRAFQGPAKFIRPLRGPFALAAHKFICLISESGFMLSPAQIDVQSGGVVELRRRDGNGDR